MGFVPPRTSNDGEEELDELDGLMPRRSIDSIRLASSLPSHHRRKSSELRQERWSRNKAPSRYFSLCRSTASLLLILYSSLCMFALYWILRFVLLRHTAYAHSVFAPPMIPKPHNVEPLVPVLRVSPNATHAYLQDELDQRLGALGLPESSLECAQWTAQDEVNYASLKLEGPYFFALNLWNNEVVFPTLARTLLSLAEHLGRDNVAISIFENGSTDNTTIAMAHFAATLSAAGVDHTIVSDPRHTDWKRVDRIAQLAVYRNLALAPLNSTSRAVPFESVIFINDVFTCPRDPLELLHQKRLQKADAACAMDWRATHSWLGFLGFKSVKWVRSEDFRGSHIAETHLIFQQVGRTITGDMFRSRFDVVAETRDGIAELFDQPGSEYSRDRWLAALPVPVSRFTDSCWNGMVAMSAGPFRGDAGPAVSFRSALDNENECSASECKTVARDFWVQGLRRWMVSPIFSPPVATLTDTIERVQVVPSVHVTYAQAVYNHASLVAHNPTLIETTLDTPPEVIEWDAIEAPESVVCYEWARGFHLDLPYRRTRESPFRR
ncbi:alpha-1,3-mannosyltransferase, partial [Phenoliferia sp. Uapishka_3]